MKEIPARIDAHHHFWDPTRATYPWMVGEALDPVRRPFTPGDLAPELAAHSISGTVLVQTISSEDETREFLELAERTDFIWGVVGWVDLTSAYVGDRLDALIGATAGKRLVGIRHQVHDESDPEWLCRADVRTGLAAVQHGLQSGCREAGPLVVRQGVDVLELFCADGFNTFHFYSIRAGKILAMDLDRDAIASAQKNFAVDNIEFFAGDIRRDMPNEQFDNIVWDASLEYFTADEIDTLMTEVKARLRPTGILSGQVIIQDVQSEEHSHIFRSTEDLPRFFRPHFQHVRLIETRYPARHNVYFYASDTTLPFLPQTAAG